jgi:uncharacterized glyoxalase superfamily protein PhnB
LEEIAGGGNMLAKGLTPILNVSNIAESFAWFEKLGWAKAWDWGDPPSFAASVPAISKSFSVRTVRAVEAEVHRRRQALWTDMTCLTGNVDFNLGGDDVDQVHQDCLAQGIEVTFPPTDMPWSVREMHVRHPDGMSSESVRDLKKSRKNKLFVTEQHSSS